MRFKLIIPLLVIMTALTVQTNAQGRVRSVNQERRIRHGVRNGELTRVEARQLQRRENEVRRTRRAAMADGTVTPRERREIRREQRRANRAIIRKKHNRLDRN